MSSRQQGRSMKIGMVGLDSSHCTIFAGMLNDSEDLCFVPEAELVGAFRGGSDQFSLSRQRIDGFTEELTGRYGVPLYETIEELARDVDAILLESTDGRQHSEQFSQMAVGKPVYVDKPFATSTHDAREMIQLATQTHTPLMSCSSLRYAAGISDLRSTNARVISCEAFGPALILNDYPGLFWYGVHRAEILFSFMGPGYTRVRCLPYRDADVLIGEWGDDRIGLVRAMRSKATGFGCVVETDTGTKVRVAGETPSWFCLLLRQIVKFPYVPMIVAQLFSVVYGRIVSKGV